LILCKPIGVFPGILARIVKIILKRLAAMGACDIFFGYFASTGRAAQSQLGPTVRTHRFTLAHRVPAIRTHDLSTLLARADLLIDVSTTGGTAIAEIRAALRAALIPGLEVSHTQRTDKVQLGVTGGT